MKVASTFFPSSNGAFLSFWLLQKNILMSKKAWWRNGRIRNVRKMTAPSQPFPSSSSRSGTRSSVADLEVLGYLTGGLHPFECSPGVDPDGDQGSEFCPVARKDEHEGLEGFREILLVLSGLRA